MVYMPILTPGLAGLVICLEGKHLFTFYNVMFWGPIEARRQKSAHTNASMQVLAEQRASPIRKHVSKGLFREQLTRQVANSCASLHIPRKL